MPLFLFSVLFGLSMDYQVFLLSRIKERYDELRARGRPGDDDPTTQAVVFGVASTARIITGAALIIVAVFAGFASGELIMFQQMGFGVAVALLIDATDHPLRCPAGDHAPARPLELVPAAVAPLAAARAGRGAGRDRRRVALAESERLLGLAVEEVDLLQRHRELDPRAR